MSKSFPMVTWGQGTNIYEVNTRQYTPEGTFNAFRKHLPRLKDMGIEVLWMMPITPISTKGRLGSLGSYYACSSYTKVNPEYGNEDDFRALVEQVHQLEMKIIIDWVANHTGQDHEWVNNHPDFYLKDEKGNFVERNGWNDAIDLDYSNEDMQNTMIECMQYWVRNFDIDGFRCDMAHLVPLYFWQKARINCDHLKQLFWLAECDDNQYLQIFDVNYSWHWMHATEKMEKNQEQDLNAILPILKEDLNLLPNACKLWFTSNHDENSWNGTEYEKYGLTAKTWAVFSCMFPGIPLIYSGQELPNHKRLSFFEKDQIDWSHDPDLHLFYKDMLELRKSNACFQTTATIELLLFPNSTKTMGFILENEGKYIVILLNFSQTETHQITINTDYLAGTYLSLFSGLKHAFQNNETFDIEAGGYLVYIKI